MKKKVFFFLFLLFCHVLAGAVKEKEPIPSAITYAFSGGRFGDNLLAYLHAKWAAYVTKRPFFYKPFKHSDKLAMHYKDAHYQSDLRLKYSKSQVFYRGMSLSEIKAFNVFYTIPYFPECMMEFDRRDHQFPYFSVNWKDPKFIEIMWDSLSPVVPIKPLELPDDRLTVAIHIRSWRWFGGDDQARLSLPLKLPPEEYYFEQAYLLASFLDLPLYIYLFTDDPDPISLIDQLKTTLQGFDVEFACRNIGVNVDNTVLEDFFAMTQFDCLIRSESNFSLIASKLGKYFVEISPKSFSVKGNVVKITDVHFEYNPENLRKNF